MIFLSVTAGDFTVGASGAQNIMVQLSSEIVLAVYFDVK